ncbi:hypothetical protein B0H17DRAFT_1207580 [Mycena rosella]|uniref:Reverse transcriptase domain-containing protein n=1 Tax=Mycena rosella TaxID=1033263 RepID=A0AAD7D6D9_MYCRO|nr:hypothetical protein B0H17DRAFT_1207580 [Mycena rosella]
MAKIEPHGMTIGEDSSTESLEIFKQQRRASHMVNSRNQKPSLASKISSSKAPLRSTSSTMQGTLSHTSHSSTLMSGTSRKRKAEDEPLSGDQRPSLIKRMAIPLIERIRLDSLQLTPGIRLEEVMPVMGDQIGDGIGHSLAPRSVIHPPYVELDPLLGLRSVRIQDPRIEAAHVLHTFDHLPPNNNRGDHTPLSLRVVDIGRDHRTDVSSSSGSSSGSRDMRKHKKPCLDLSKFGFNANAVIAYASLPQHKRKVLDTLENYTRDAKESLRLMRGHAGCPSFTETGWMDILAGSYVDFDDVARELLDFGQVTTQGQWVDVWGKYKRCINYAFEDRNDELDKYFDYIQGLFAQNSTELAHNVIGCDKAIRRFIGSSKTALFDELHLFVQFERSYLIPNMVHFRPAGGRGNRDRTHEGFESKVVDRPRLSAGSTDFSHFSHSAFAHNSLVYDDSPVINLDPDVLSESFLPRYLRGYDWSERSPTSSHTARCTEIDSPLPRPPVYEFENQTALDTIHNNPHLFRVSTEIHTDRLRALLHNHPNPAFVDSVIATLKEGAWPFANTKHNDGSPLMYNNSCILPKTEREREFLEAQSREEEELGRHSPVFGPDLLPGMYSTPVLAVPKPHSQKLRLCSHMSAGEFCQNNMMDRPETRGARLDTLHNFIPAVLRYRRRNPGKHLVAFKSDVKSAFRLILSHPLWQIKQIVTTNYPTRADVEAGIDRGPLIRRVDWRSCFGSRGSPRLWSSVMGLVVWTAQHEKKIEDLYAYVDDNFGIDEEGRLTLYPGYQKFMPLNQVQLLELWDEVGVRHSEDKQLWGGQLVIIGFLVDVNEMTITLPTTAKADLIAAVDDFINSPSRKRTLHDWQQLSGWITWSLNVFPLLCPALCHIYAKISEKVNTFAIIYINVAVKQDLFWFIHHVRASPGIFAFHAIDWNPRTEADFSIRCDACPLGMGFWSELLCQGFYSPVPVDAPKDTIFFWEATCVLSALEWFCLAQRKFFPQDRPTRLSIFTDNLNTVQIFSSLAAEPAYNILLKAAVDLLILHHVDLRVLHIPGIENTVADAISRENFIIAYSTVPGLLITQFQPPRCVLGAAQK